MRAVAVFPETKSIALIDHPEPRLVADSQVKLQMLDVGVCGTDREIARFDYGSVPPGSKYLVLGHESLGRVLEVGDSVTRVKPGDLVVTMVRRPCPHASCSACTHGRQDFCFTGDFKERGIKELHGYMTEQVVEDERFMHVVPAQLRAVGVLVEPLTIAEKALLQVSDVQKRLPWTAAGCQSHEAHGQRALVLGAGPVGLLGALALLVRGFETWVYSRDAPGSNKARWIESVGARHLPDSAAPPELLGQKIGNIDLIYEATGASGLSFRALASLGVNGVFVFTGVPGRKAPIALDADLLMRNLVLQNQLVFGTVNAGSDAFVAAIEDLARFLQRWPAQLSGLITGQHAPEDYAKLLLEPAVGIKNVVRFAD